MLQWPLLLPAMLTISLVIPTAAQAYLIKDYGFTNVVNAPNNQKASIHSIVNYDSAYAPAKYDYTYIVKNTGTKAINEFGVFAGALAGATKKEFAAGVGGGGAGTKVAVCAPGGALPGYISNALFPDNPNTWCFTVLDDGNATPTDYAVIWSKKGGLGVGNTLTFHVASPNAPITGNPFIDPPVVSANFLITFDDPVNTVTAVYVPEPETVPIFGLGLLGLALMRRKKCA